MSSAKALLKRARESIASKEYEAALDAATKVLAYEPANYNGYVFSGLANLNLGNSQAAEAAYKKAIELNPSQLLAWQGLANYYEKEESWTHLSETLKKLMEMYQETGDHQKCYEALQRYIHIARQHGSRLDFVAALKLELPSSSLSNFLEHLPAPLTTLKRIADVLEEEEDEAIRREVDIRRTRLNAGSLEEVQRNVKMEVYSNSSLDAMYEEILSYSNDDNERRDYERRLLKHQHDRLRVVPLDQKPTLRSSLWEMAHGMVFLSIPELLAWQINIEWTDVELLDEFDPSVLQRCVGIFPSEGIAKLIQGYFKYRADQGYTVPRPSADSDDEVEEAEGPEALDLVIDGYDRTINSVFAQRVMCYVYLHEKDYTSAKDFAAEGIKILKQMELELSLELPRTLRFFKLVTASAYLHIQRPRHLPQARELFDEVLAVEPNNIMALRGQGSYYQFVKDWSMSTQFFARVASLSPEDIEAKVELAWNNVQKGHLNEGKAALQALIHDLENDEGRNLVRATLWWRLGECMWHMGDDYRSDRTHCYTAFVQCLKLNASYAPAFTSLGIFYKTIEDEQTRALKCFQKAFELDVRQVIAAEELAKGFALGNDWDLVETVVRKVIDSGAAGSKSLGASNAWAWKGLGIVELNARKYSAAIQAFQTALRVQSRDVQSWMGLGEGYYNSGRYTSALKAYQRAKELESGNWDAQYSVGEVQLRLGLHESAVLTFSSLSGVDGKSFAAYHALMRTHLDWATSWIGTGFYGRAGESVLAILDTASKIEGKDVGQSGSVWKIVGDAMMLGDMTVQTLPDKRVRQTISNILDLLAMMEEDNMEDLKDLGPAKSVNDIRKSHEANELSRVFASIATAAYRLALLLALDEKIVPAAAWYDLGLAHRRLYETSQDKSLLSFAARCFKQALRFEVGNALFWNAFGVVSLLADDVPVATHAFIKSIEVNSRSAKPWMNLGYLYLSKLDLDLSYQAFTRAQSLDPEDPHVWLGHATVSELWGDVEQARNLYRHSVEISEAAVPEANLSYANSALWESDASLPAYAIKKYLEQLPRDVTALHLHATLCERLGDIDSAFESLNTASELLEMQYEKAASSDVEFRYAVIKCGLGRVLVAKGEFEKAATVLESVLDTVDAIQDDATLQRCKSLRTTTSMSLGLAYFFVDKLEDSLSTFEDALGKDSKGNPDLRVLLSQILWALEGDEQRETAKDQLFDCIQTYHGFLPAILGLNAIGLLEGDPDLVDAADKEIKPAMVGSEKPLSAEAIADVELLRTAGAQLEADTRLGIAVASDAVFTRPTLHRARAVLARMLLQVKHPARKVVGQMIMDPNEVVAGQAIDVSEGYRIQGAVAEASEAQLAAQRSVMMAPWSIHAWESVVM